MQFESSSKSAAASPFAEFEALLARKEVFVLLDEARLDAEKASHSPAEMKQVSLWMKLHKRELRTFVKASIHIVPSAAKRLAAKAFAVVFAKFWGYPMIMTSSRQEALVLAQKLLTGDPAKTDAD